MPLAWQPHSHQKEYSVDFIGSDDLSVPEVLNNPRVNFLNLRGNQRPDASFFESAASIKVLCTAH